MVEGVPVGFTPPGLRLGDSLVWTQALNPYYHTTMITPAVLALLGLWTNWSAVAINNASVTVQRQGLLPTISIATPTPETHLAGLQMNTASLQSREENPRQAVVGYYLDKGIFTQWKFNGSKGADSLEFGSQGVIISKRAAGRVDFKNDIAPDRFVFSNKIDIAKCSEKHGIQCHPLNHLQQVTITNFGKEDKIVLQGKTYGYRDVRNGVLPGVPSSRLRIETIDYTPGS